MKTLTARFFQLFAATTFLFCSAGTASASNDGDGRDVCIVFVQGDVRLSPGDGKHPNLDKGWQQAEPGISIEQGFSLATGDGRAEIEFENSGHAFLAENSLLLFRQLSAQEDRVVTRLSLVTGTATFSLHPQSKETFFLETPTEKIQIGSPENFFARMEVYLDGTAITPQEDKGEEIARRGLPKLHLVKGQSVFFQGGEVIPLPESSNPKEANEWDAWVSNGLEERNAAMAAALKASGLSAPIPGLADLHANGTFFSCEPYGTCWEPTQQDADAGQSQGAQTPIPSANSPNSGFQPQTVSWVETNWGPCSSYASHTVSSVAHTQAELEKLLRRKTMAESHQSSSWDSVLCQTASWIPHRGRYAMVLPVKSHPRCEDKSCKRVRPPPMYVVHAGGKVGYVPRHPNDVKGKPPINLKNGIIVPPARAGEPLRHVKWDPSEKVTILEKSPKEIRNEIGAHLVSATAPKIQAHLVAETMRIESIAAAHQANPQIVYDYKTQRFLLSDASPAGGKFKEVAIGGITHHGEVSSFADGRSGRYAEAIARNEGLTSYVGVGGISGSNSSESSHSSGERTSRSYSSGTSHSGGERSMGSNSSGGSSAHTSNTSSSGGSSASSSAASNSSGTSRGRPN